MPSRPACCHVRSDVRCLQSDHDQTEPGSTWWHSGIAAGDKPAAHLIVVVDVSGSMNTLIRLDSEARIVGSSRIEGHSMTMVESSVPSRRMVAVNVVRSLLERMEPSDRMTLVAFDDQSHPLARRLPPGRDLAEAVRQLADVGGGGTSLGKALAEVRKSLTYSSGESETHRIVLLTDGEDSEPERALDEAEQLGAEFRLPIFALRTGDSRADFLMQICRTTLGGTFNIENERQAEECFQKFFTGQKNILATNVKLQLWLSPEIFVRELYRTKPEVLFVGDAHPDDGNIVTVAIEYMERGKMYEFLFRSTGPCSRKRSVPAGQSHFDLRCARESA